MNLSSQQAIQALKAGEARAQELNEPSSLAIVDAGGNLIAFLRTENATFGTAEIAINKAYTSSAFKVRTADLYADAQPGGEIYGLQNTAARPFVVFGGGVPVFVNGQLICSVGVSGGPVSADVQISDAMAISISSSF
ncbi:unnamed protein product, partial [Mesorhabditis spiculigera]